MDFTKQLKTISELLSDIPYGLIGSLNMYIQWMEVSPRDIDIIAPVERIMEIDERLKEYRTKEIYFDISEWRNSLRSFYDIDWVEIELLWNICSSTRPADQINERFTMDYNGIKVNCIALDSEIQVYKNMWRPEKAKMIEDFIKSK